MTATSICLLPDTVPGMNIPVDYVRFGDVARDQLGMQCQYASAYVHGRGTTPNLGEGLRFTGTPADYHGLTIHRDDVNEFVLRVKTHQHTNHIQYWPELGEPPVI